jgi:hypothetical protein
VWQWPWKGLIGNSFQEKLTNLRCTCLAQYIHVTVCADWLALINCANSSPVWAQVQEENLFLLSNNSPPTWVSSIYRAVPSPLLSYKDANIQCADCWVPHSFLEKYPSDNSWNHLGRYCSAISDRTTIHFLQVYCSCELYYFLQNLLLQARSHTLLPCNYHWECRHTARLCIASISVNRKKKTSSSIFVALIPGNFSVRYLNTGAIWSVALTVLYQSLFDVQRRQQNVVRFYQQ